MPDEDADHQVRFALSHLELLNVVTRRAREEISAEELPSALDPLFDAFEVPALNVELLLAQLRHQTEPAFARAVAEVALLAAQRIGNPELLLFVERTLGSRDQMDAEAAERHLRQGRPDLAVQTLVNAAAVAAQDGADSTAAMNALRRAWELLLAIGRGDEYVPRAVSYDHSAEVARVAELFARFLVRHNETAECLAVVDAALEAVTAGSVMFEHREAFAMNMVRLLTHAAHCEMERHGLAAAELRVRRTREFAGDADAPLAGAQARIAEGIVAAKQGDVAGELALLAEAQSFANHYRRSFPYEKDKSSAATETQTAFMWAAERLIETGRPWEALAAVEGLRSRALLDLLGLTPAIRSAALPEGESEALEMVRAIALAGSGEAWGLREVWRDRIRKLDGWLESIAPRDPDYAAIVRGDSATAAALQRWAVAQQATAVITWLLGESYSFVIAIAENAPPVFVRTHLTISWLRSRAAELQEHVRLRRSPPRRLFDALSAALLEPVQDAIRPAATVYLCPTQVLHALPLSALAVDGMPLSVQKRTAVVPSLSVLRVLQRADRSRAPGGPPVVFGPDFPERAREVAATLGVQPVRSLTEPGLRVPSRAVRECPTLHIVSHGFWDAADPWASGLAFEDERLTGRDLLPWRIEARLATLEACDTHRREYTPTDDNFGLARFFHLIGVPTLLLSDWEVHTDVTSRFMKTFYRSLLASSGDRGEAFRAAANDVRNWTGPDEAFFWAPFTLAGVAG